MGLDQSEISGGKGQGMEAAPELSTENSQMRQDVVQVRFQGKVIGEICL